MLGQRGTAMMEFVSAAPGTKPWAETHAYYDQNLGAPGITSALLSDMAYAGGLYTRPFANGAVVVNPTGTPAPYTPPPGKIYKNPETNTTVANPASIQIPAHDGMMLIDTAGAGGGNPAAPVVTITAPLDGATYGPTQTVNATATATDADGIASVTMKLDGGNANTATLTGGIYSFNFGVLQPGSHTISVTATDSNGAPLTTTASANITVNAPPPPNTGPGVTVTGPSDVVILPQTTICSCLVTDTDGVASVTMNMDGEGLDPGDRERRSTYTHDFGALCRREPHSHHPGHRPELQPGDHDCAAGVPRRRRHRRWGDWRWRRGRYDRHGHHDQQRLR